MDYGNDRISSSGNKDKESFNNLLEKASIEAGRILGTIQAIAGTANCKGVQINGLKRREIKDCIKQENRSYRCPLKPTVTWMGTSI